MYSNRVLVQLIAAELSRLRVASEHSCGGVCCHCKLSAAPSLVMDWYELYICPTAHATNRTDIVCLLQMDMRINYKQAYKNAGFIINRKAEGPSQMQL